MSLAWVTATIVAITIAAAAVSSVRSEVTDTPTALGVAASPLAKSEDKTQAAPAHGVPSANKQADAQEAASSAVERKPEAAPFSPPRVDVPTTTTIDEPATKRQPHGKSLDPDESPARTESSPQEIDATANAPTSVRGSPNDPPSQSATSTTSTTSTTTTSPPEPEAEAYTREISTEAGSISVVVNGDDVNFKRGFARDGWTLDLAQSGPSVVRVRYLGNDNSNTTVSIDARVVSGELDVTILRSQ